MLENKCDWKISKADQNGNVYYYFPKDEDEFKEAVVKNGGMSVYVYQEGKFIDEFHTKSQGDKWTSSILNYLKTMSKDGGIFYRYYKNCKFFAIPKNTFSKDDFKIIKDNINNNIPLNQILYGPPGTGKTYHTIDKALEIFGENLESRDEKKAKFDEYVRKGQIVFTTFHQSYGYEEFVEGIKPRIDSKENSKEIEYEIKDGIFKELCDRANKKNDIEEIQNSFWKDCESSSINFNDYKFEYYKEDGKKGLKHEDEKLIFFQTFNDLINEVGFSYSYYFTNKNNIIINKLRGTLNNEETINTYKKHYEAILDYFYEEYLPKLSNYIIIIDEINRGNVSKIFGELITLIEPSKRIGEKEELKVKLPYSGEEFGVPKNVYIIGTMNTADRSITSLDTALRRRFEFIEMMPDVSKLSMDCEGINLQELLKAINTRIEYLLDREKTIGHAFFIGVENLEDLKKVFQNKIIPLLQEYFYNDYALINAVLNDNGMIFEDKKDDKYLQKIKNLDSVNSERSIYNIASFDDKIWDKIEIYQAIYNDEIANKLKNENE
ncbi:restriction endonuclease [Campylobacter jejuni]|nr:restriction endonuclease [Campylobacter jejuni]EAJ7153730.1 restriction endonuclease [Campylobacter jejuni]EAK0569627.1 restriction endonuclease [Campylobacter jejuni]EAK7319348.1 restriction endonuclease [Campylobacter jejuni]EAL8576580.1 restriction endonuclease [Campylobacter jejuni]